MNGIGVWPLGEIVDLITHGLSFQGSLVFRVAAIIGGCLISIETGAQTFELTDLGPISQADSFAQGSSHSLEAAAASLIANSTISQAFLSQEGALNDLNWIPGPSGEGWILVEAFGINDAGNMAGRGYLDLQEHAFLYYNQGVVTDLGLLAGGSSSYALGLNNSNQVVGAASIGSTYHATLWKAGSICDLNSTINAPGWELKEACGINDPGQIVGWGTLNGLARAFILTPKCPPVQKGNNATVLQDSSTNAQAFPGGPATNLMVTVNRAPNLYGGTIKGSLQQLCGENARANGGFNMAGDWILPGTPDFVINGNPINVGILVGSGSPLPAGYQVSINKKSAVNCFRTHVNPVALPGVATPPIPTGSRIVIINKSGQSYGDASTLRDLRLNGNSGIHSVPEGTYGNFTINGGSGLILGKTGGTNPAQYYLQSLTLNGNSIVRVVGPVVLTVANGFSVNGTMGVSNNPDWLQIQVSSGGVTINGGSAIYGHVLAPSGEVIVNGNSLLLGSSASDQFTLNAGGIVGWGVITNQVGITPPVIQNQPANLTVVQGMAATFMVTVKTNSSQTLVFRWYFNSKAYPGGTNASLTLSNVQPADAGNYCVQVSNAAGTATSSNAVLQVSVVLRSESLDSDYDGMSDAREIAAETDPFNPLSVPAVRLGYWSFDDTNTWAGSAGQLPLLVSNVVGIPSWNGNGVEINSTSRAALRYRDVETSGNANINLRCGTIRLWFKPDWSSVTAGGNGPQTLGRLIEMGRPGTNTGWWTLLFNASGDELNLVTQSNGVCMTNFTAPVLFNSNIWYQVVLTYGSINSQLYVDCNALVTNGRPVQFWPDATERAAGFCLGSDDSGCNQARGAFDEMETFNYQLSSADILANYQSSMTLDSDGDGVSNISENQLGLNPTSYKSLNGLGGANVMQVFTPLK